MSLISSAQFLRGPSLLKLFSGELSVRFSCRAWSVALCLMRPVRGLSRCLRLRRKQNIPVNRESFLPSVYSLIRMWFVRWQALSLLWLIDGLWNRKRGKRQGHIRNSFFLSAPWHRADWMSSLWFWYLSVSAYLHIPVWSDLLPFRKFLQIVFPVPVLLSTLSAGWAFLLLLLAYSAILQAMTCPTCGRSPIWGISSSYIAISLCFI